MPKDRKGDEYRVFDSKWLPEEAEVFHLPVEMEDGQLPKINGHQIKLGEWNAFVQYCRLNGKVAEAAQASNICRETLWKWRQTAWWKWLEERYILEAARRTLVHIATNQHRAAETLLDVMENNRPDDKTAGARVNAARTMLEVGNDPVLKKSPAVQITHNSMKVEGDLNIDKLLALQQSNPDKLHEMAETFEIPADLKDFRDTSE